MTSKRKAPLAKQAKRKKSAGADPKRPSPRRHEGSRKKTAGASQGKRRKGAKRTKRTKRERSQAAKRGWATRRRRAKAMAATPKVKGLKIKLDKFESATDPASGLHHAAIVKIHKRWYDHKSKVRGAVPVRTYEDIITQIGLELGLTMGRIESYITS